jgi:hypothetical protein
LRKGGARINLLRRGVQVDQIHKLADRGLALSLRCAGLV